VESSSTKVVAKKAGPGGPAGEDPGVQECVSVSEEGWEKRRARRIRGPRTGAMRGLWARLATGQVPSQRPSIAWKGKGIGGRGEVAE
jgi:hypothetical protein